ncbi:acyl-CoA N-acyltransferase [Mycena crocata]|nr:acyl-CoA N-acyltransferase [Mycena crocata]
MRNDDIYIRKYRPSDFPQIRALLFEGFVTSEGSPGVVAKRQYLFRAPSVIAYLVAGAGLGLFWRGNTTCGTLLCVTGLGLFTAVRYGISQMINDFCQAALKEDMGDIEAHYRVPSAFFVAARPYDAKDREYEEVVGYVGFEYLPEKDPSKAEVRRMIVSARYRRRGVAERLMKTLIAHAESIPDADVQNGSELRCINLWLSEFQPGAQRLYERLGWKAVRLEWLGNAARGASTTHFRRPLQRAAASGDTQHTAV